jgi:nitroreductase
MEQAVNAMHISPPLVPASVHALIEARAAVNLFDPRHPISDREIEQLAELAIRAPSAFNLQNWRLHAVRTPEWKARLRAAAWDQAKVEEASVTFVVSGEIARAEDVEARLAPSVAAGPMSPQMAAVWIDMAQDSYAKPQAARDEAIRSATLLAATLMFAAEGSGLSTAPMSGFDGDAVSELIGLPPHIFPVLLVAVGRPLPGNWPQKPRPAHPRTFARASTTAC